MESSYGSAGASLSYVTLEPDEKEAAPQAAAPSASGVMLNYSVYDEDGAQKPIATSSTSITSIALTSYASTDSWFEEDKDKESHDDEDKGKQKDAHPEATREAVHLVQADLSDSSDEETPRIGSSKNLQAPIPARLISSHYRDWNEEFQRTLSLRDSHERSQMLAEIARDFEHTALHFAELVVSEMFLPPEYKSVRPIGIGGIAGGAKFSIKGILLKYLLTSSLRPKGPHLSASWIQTLKGFVTDTELAPGFFMYGGKERNDTFAYKAAGHELKGLSAIFSAIERLHLPIHVPLTCLIDFRGFRLIAVATLPINKSTIIYGSSDGGVSVHDDDAHFSKHAAALFSELNLQPHWVGPAGHAKRLFGPGDIEGHLGLDGRYYLLDYARVFPPEYPSRGSRDVFFKCLRAEFVKKHGPLNSDAFSGWGNGDAHFKDHCEAVRLKTEHLYHVAVKEFAENVLSKEPNSESLERLSDEEDPLREPTLTALMHAHGLNMRHLGLVLKHTKNDVWRQVIKTEMVARVLKTQIREKLRAMGYATHQSANQPYREAVSRIFLEMTRLNENRVNEFWTVLVKRLVMEKYFVPQAGDHVGDFLTLEERRSDYDFLQSIRMRLLFSRIEEMMDQHLARSFTQHIPTRRVQEIIIQSGAAQLAALPPFTEKTLVSLPLKCKRLPFIELAEARLVLKRVWADRNRRFQSVLRLDASALALTLNSLRSSASAMTDSAELPCRMSEALFLLSLQARKSNMGTVAHKESDEARYLRRALIEADNAIAVRPDFGDAHYFRGLALGSLGMESEAQSAFTKALDINLTEIRDRLLNELERGVELWDVSSAPYECAAVLLSAARALAVYFAPLRDEAHRRVVARVHVLLCKMFLNSLAAGDYQLMKAVAGTDGTKPLNLLQLHLRPLISSIVDNVDNVVAKLAAKELETALAVPGHGPSAFDDLWKEVHGAEPKIAIFDFITMAADSDAVAAAVFAGLAKVRDVDINSWVRRRQNPKEIIGDWARFVPALESFASKTQLMAASFTSLSTHVPSLTSLDLRSSVYRDDTLKVLVSALRKWALKKLVIEGALPGTAEVFGALSQGSGSTLTSLTLRDIPSFDASSLGALFKASGATLTDLDLSITEELGAAFPALNQSAVALRSLSLSGYVYKDESIAVLAPTLARLHTLKLSCSQLGPNALASLAQSAIALRHLSLEGLQRSVTAAHLSALATAPFAPHLESIFLKDLLGVTSDFFAALVPACTSLRRVHLEMMGNLQGTTFGASLGALPALQEFIGHNNANRFWTDPQFIDFLAGAKKLRALSLGNVRELTWASLQHLFTVPKCLRELDIGGNVRGMDQQWPKLLVASDSTLKASEINTGLTHLNILQIPMNRHGLMDIVEACPNLEVLDISQIKCTEQGLLELCKLRKLRTLEMSLHEFHSTEVLLRLVSKIPTLTYLKITNESSRDEEVSKHPNGSPRFSRALLRNAAANKGLVIVF